jgi:hypothetical protein
VIESSPREGLHAAGSNQDSPGNSQPFRIRVSPENCDRKYTIFFTIMRWPLRLGHVCFVIAYKLFMTKISYDQKPNSTVFL